MNFPAIILLSVFLIALYPLPTHASYKTSIKAFELTVQKDRAFQNRNRTSNFYLRDNYAALLMAQPESKAKGLIIMLHGFTAGPWQYELLGKQLYQHGYTIYAPRLPGHGWMNSKIESTHLKLPRSNQQYRYEAYVDKLYSQIKDFPLPIHLVGLSGGANLALRLVEKYPHKFTRTVAMAPFLGADYPGQLLYGFVNSMNYLSFSGFGQLLDGLVRDFPGITVKPNDPHPHTSNTVGNAFPIYSVAATIQSLPKSVQFLTTEGDPLAGKQPVGHLYFKTGGPQLHSWHHFRAEEEVPHPMTNDFEFKHPEKRDEIFEMVVAHLIHGKQFHRPPDHFSQYDLEQIHPSHPQVLRSYKLY